MEAARALCGPAGSHWCHLAAGYRFWMVCNWSAMLGEVTVSVRMRMPAPAAGVGVDLGHRKALREIDRIVGFLIGGHAEDHGEQVIAAGEVFEGDADIETGVKLEVETEYRFDGGHGAGNVFANFPGFQDRRIRDDECHPAAWSGCRQQNLGRKEGACGHPRAGEDLHPTRPSAKRDPSGYRHHTEIRRIHRSNTTVTPFPYYASIYCVRLLPKGNRLVKSTTTTHKKPGWTRHPGGVVLGRAQTAVMRRFRR